jgi:hypothetical protein
VGRGRTGRAHRLDNQKENSVEILKHKIIELLRSRGDHREAALADKELPDAVDLDRDAGLLTKFGVHPPELIETRGSKSKNQQPSGQATIERNAMTEQRNRPAAEEQRGRRGFEEGQETRPEDDRVGKYSDGIEHSPKDERLGQFSDGNEALADTKRQGQFSDVEPDDR